MNILFERRAEIAMRSLRGVDQKQVTRSLYELQALTPADIFPHHKIHKVSSPSGEKLYIYFAGLRLRLVFNIDEDNCRIIDIADHDRLGRLLSDRGQR
jgi:hypothetical protein